jgi:hypothetical protein
LETGVKTTGVAASDIADDLLGNYQGSTVRIGVTRMAALISAMTGPAYATRAELYADLSWPDGATGHVHGDPDPARIGTYRKSGNPGTGSWTRIGDLPTGTVGQALLADEADARRAATADGGVLRLTNVAGSADAATADLAAGVADIELKPGMLLFYVPVATNTAAGPTLAVGGFTRELLLPDGTSVGAGDMVAGTGYILKVHSNLKLHLLGGGASADDIAQAVAAEEAARITAIDDVNQAITAEEAARIAAIDDVDRGHVERSGHAAPAADDAGCRPDHRARGRDLRAADGAVPTRPRLRRLAGPGAAAVFYRGQAEAGQDIEDGAT